MDQENHTVPSNIGQPPSYLLSKENTYLDDIEDMTGTGFELRDGNVNLKDQTQTIYQFNNNPVAGQGEELQINLCLQKTPKYNEVDPPVSRTRHLYTAKRYGTWFRMADMPPIYEIVAESRSLYCFRPGFSMNSFDESWIRLQDILPFMKPHRDDSWRVPIHTDPKKKALMVYLFREKKPKGAPNEYEWTDGHSKRVIALETVADSDDQSQIHQLTWLSNVQDKRLVHALAMVWVTRIWHDAKEDYLEKKAHEIRQTLTLKQRLTIKVFGKQKTDVMAPLWN